MKVPAYVCLITEAHICLSGGVGDVRLPLRHSILSTRLGRHEGYLSLSYVPGAQGTHGADLRLVLVELNRLGLAFAEDQSSSAAPAHLMRELQAAGKLRTTFTAIDFRGPGDWQLSEIAP